MEAGVNDRMIAMLKKTDIGKIVLIGLILAGGVWSYKDYQEWKHLEMDKYGHGYGEAVPAMALANLYENQILGVRIRYPDTWKVDEAKEFINLSPKITRNTLLRSGKRQTFVWLGTRVKISVQKVNQSLVDLVNMEETNIKNKNWEMLRERENVNTDEANIVILTWKQGGIIHQRAMAMDDNRLVVIDSNAVESEWKVVEATVLEMYKSLVIF